MIRVRTACAVLFGAVLAWPAASAGQEPTAAAFRQILGETQKVTSPNGIDEARAVTIGGIRQWITVRGRDRRNPILLVLHGGPALPELARRYLFEAPWTDYFTVVEWDQRGAGQTFALNDPAAVAPTLSEDRMVADAEALVDDLRRTYGKKKIFLLGHSWGSILGLRVAQERPDRLYAYVGMSQVISMREAEPLGYAFALQSAEGDHNTAAVAELKAIAPYPEPGGSVPLAKLGVERKWETYYGGLIHGRHDFRVIADSMRLSPDYPQADVLALINASTAFSARLSADMARTDFTGLTRLDCPVFLFLGRYDETSPTPPALRWFDALSAPSKRLVWFENSAHMITMEEPGKVLVHLVDDVRPLAVKDGDAAPAEATR